MNKNLNNIEGPVNLTDLKLRIFTEQDTLDYCQLNDIKYKNVILLDLSCNELTDIRD